MTGCTNPGKTQKKSNIQIGGNYKICDTCKTTIIVGHNECTDCADLQVDSGFIYISQNLFDQIDTMKKDTGLFTPNRISASDLYLSDKKYFYKLWPDTINFKDFYKVYRVTGKVTEVKHRVFAEGSREPYPSFYFHVDKAKELDTAYAKKVKQQ